MSGTKLCFLEAIPRAESRSGKAGTNKSRGIYRLLPCLRHCVIVSPVAGLRRVLPSTPPVRVGDGLSWVSTPELAGLDAVASLFTRPTSVSDFAADYQSQEPCRCQCMMPQRQLWTTIRHKLSRQPYPAVRPDADAIRARCWSVTTCRGTGDASSQDSDCGADRSSGELLAWHDVDPLPKDSNSRHP